MDEDIVSELRGECEVAKREFDDVGARLIKIEKDVEDRLEGSSDVQVCMLVCLCVRACVGGCARARARCAFAFLLVSDTRNTGCMALETVGALMLSIILKLLDTLSPSKGMTQSLLQRARGPKTGWSLGMKLSTDPCWMQTKQTRRT